MIGGVKKGSWDGVHGGRIESEIDDMIEGMMRNVGGPTWGVHTKGR